jgi:hypothetical protein
MSASQAAATQNNQGVITSASNAVQCYINAYTYEGGTYTLSSVNAGLLSVTTDKDINKMAGGFQLELAPSGPGGHGALTWARLLTPLSFVMVSLSRGPARRTVMAGIVTSCVELQQATLSGIQRVTVVSGADIGYFFSQNSFYSLAYLSGAPGSLLGAAGVQGILSAGRAAGTPAELCQDFYQKVMAAPTGNVAAGTQPGVLARTRLNLGGDTYSFADLIGTQFEEFNNPIAIPTGQNYLTTGTWESVYKSLLQFPFYEFFVDTVQDGMYPTTGGMALPAPSSAHPNLFPTSEIVAVGRVNPLPRLINSGSVDSPKYSMDTSLWEALPQFWMGGDGILNQDIGFSDSEAANFFVLQAVQIDTLFGGSNGNISPFIATQALLVDEGSISRYGYRPNIVESQWFYDPHGVNARKLAANGQGQGAMTLLYNDLRLRVASLWEPLPIMASGTLTIPCRPDVTIGSVFNYVPFKDGIQWSFYVEGVSHSYRFQGSMSTTLTLTRGLPTSVYQNNELLTAAHTGNAYWIDGQLQVNDVDAGLTSISISAVASNDAFSTPQGGPQPIS